MHHYRWTRAAAWPHGRHCLPRRPTTSPRTRCLPAASVPVHLVSQRRATLLVRPAQHSVLRPCNKGSDHRPAAHTASGRPLYLCQVANANYLRSVRAPTLENDSSVARHTHRTRGTCPQGTGSCQQRQALVLRQPSSSDKGLALAPQAASAKADTQSAVSTKSIISSPWHTEGACGVGGRAASNA